MFRLQVAGVRQPLFGVDGRADRAVGLVGTRIAEVERPLGVGLASVAVHRFLQRAAREAAGRLACLLAERADCVVQMFCGLPTVLKGELPPC